MRELKGKRAWAYVDKSTWGPGRWQDEPDRVFWLENDLVCLILRGPVGGLCGYVGVPEGHSMYGLKDESETWPYIEHPHGGLTWTGELPGDEVAFLCDLAVEGKPLEYASYWYFGFDCAHAGDVSPAMNAFVRQSRRTTEDVVQSALTKAGFDPKDAADPMVSVGLEFLEKESKIFPSDSYKDIDYVLDEVSKLAAQISTLEKDFKERVALRRQDNREQEQEREP